MRSLTRPLLAVAMCHLFVLAFGVESGLAQIPNNPAPTVNPTEPRGSSEQQPQRSVQSELLEGLLDLSAQEELPVAEEVDPTFSIHRLMQSATDFLRLGKPVYETSVIQADIIHRLDELIDVLQQNQKSSTSSTDSSLQTQTTESVQRSQSERPESSSTRENQTGPPVENNASVDSRTDQSSGTPSSESTDSQTAPPSNSPGQAGRGSSQSVRLNDPTELQQSVWGHLPERLRTQMQSRMVEQFLPSYRQQLEAYYRSLLIQEARP